MSVDHVATQVLSQSSTVPTTLTLTGVRQLKPISRDAERLAFAPKSAGWEPSQWLEGPRHTTGPSICA